MNNTGSCINPVKNNNEKENISYFRKVKAMLIILYSIQGLIVSFIFQTLITILKKELTYSEIATLQLCSYPFSLKLLWSPLVDNYYIISIGKRKSWIIPAQIIIGVLLFILSYNFKFMIENKQIQLFTVICFILIFFVATQDIALDGWALTLCRDNNSLAASCQTIGWIVGQFSSMSIFSFLSSPTFCKEWLNIEVLLDVPNYIFTIGVYVIFLTILLIFISEKPFLDSSITNEVEIEENKGTIETIKSLYKIFTRDIILKYLFMTALINFSFSYYTSVPNLVLIDKGFPSDYLQFISSITIPISIYVSNKMESCKKDFNKIYFNGIFYYIILAIFTQLFLFYYNFILNDILEGNLIPIKCYIMLVSILQTIVNIVMYSGSYGFMSMVVDKSIGGTYITALYSFNNLTKKIPGYFILNAVELYGFNIVGIFSIAYLIVCYLLFSDKIIAIENQGPEQWKLSNINSETYDSKKLT